MTRKSGMSVDNLNHRRTDEGAQSSGALGSPYITRAGNVIYLPVSSLPANSERCSSAAPLSIRAGEIGGGVIFCAVVIAPWLIVLGIVFACLTLIPELVQH
jgi:hypothetical protein